MTLKGDEKARPGCLVVGVLLAVILSQLPAVGIYHYWFFRGRPHNAGWIDPTPMLGFIAPPFLIGGWILAVPLMISSSWARRNVWLWIALAFGIIGQLMYGQVIGYL